MRPAERPITAVDRLAAYLLDGPPPDRFAEELVGWLIASARFRAFVEANRDKIRKKIRGAADAEARRDVRAELLAARLLLADRRIQLAFEAHGSVRGGPDFTVTFRGERPFNLEVTRMRRPPETDAFVRLVLAKLRQLPPIMPNGLVVAVDGDRAAIDDVEAAARLLRARADADEAFLERTPFRDRRGFFDRFLRLGAVIVWCEAAGDEARAAAWTNRSARIPLPARALRACLRCLGAPSPDAPDPASRRVRPTDHAPPRGARL